MHTVTKSIFMNGGYFKLEINNRLYLKERCFQIQILAKVLLQQFLEMIYLEFMLIRV